MTQTFKVTDFMGIEGAAEIQLSDGRQIVVLAGENGAGKSSFRLAIQSLIKYGGSKLIPDPIHEGKTESRAEFTDTKLDVRLERVWKLGKEGEIKSTFGAYALDGAKHEKPAEFVAGLIDAVIIDPSEFVNFEEKKQREVLLSKVELPFDPDELAAKRKGYFDGRTDKTRDVKRVRAQLAALPAADPSVPVEAVKSAALVAELDAIREHNIYVDRLAQAQADAAAERLRIEEKGRALAVELEQAKADYMAARNAETAATAAAESAQRKSGEAIAEQLATIDEVNEKVRKQAERAKVAAELAALEADEAKLTENIEAIDKQKADGLAAAQFPFPGMSVDDDGVTVNGRSFKLSLNEGEQQYVAFEIATSGEPPLKLVFIRNGDALDNKTLARIIARAEERGWTIIADRGRDNSAEFGFVFNEGTLAVPA